ncbi:unnamed protein product [Aphanomyces euteiches]|uniref:PDZ domain-containing protein n=1 Tax=Aphanomyces euteiches TaxID=100861 RepID=A0A6G0WB83_9STRA|nr:hypothetical protein Ae201684_017571 [Aphanomyces euteiches]KAH9076077.1 hypothetical protein Ae201684P_012567 [Aphanomyces euteiches]KAH9154167.1 hypothetical protein AeRB84_003690 [Aphanomyces euteiches]
MSTTASRVSYNSEIDDTPAIIEYIWCGENVGLELVRPVLSDAKPISHVWKEGELGIIFAIDFFAKKVYVRRVTKQIDSIKTKYLLHTVNSIPVTAENYQEMMVVLKSGRDAGQPQTLEFLPRPQPVMVKSIPPAGELEKAGVTTDYELAMINNINVDNLSMDQIGRMLQDSNKPCHMTFGLPVHAEKDAIEAMLARLDLNNSSDIVRV